MFDVKKQTLGKKCKKNVFEKEVVTTTSAEGALKLTTSGNVFVDDFFNLSKYKAPRDIHDIFNTMSIEWREDKKKALRMIGYIRLITRNTVLPDGTKLPVQRGQGLKFEYFGRMLWLSINHEATFKKNLDLFISIGSWDDIFELMFLDLSYEHNEVKFTLDWEFLVNKIKEGLNNPSQSELIKKYLPTIHSAKQCKTLRAQCNAYIGKFVANHLFAEIEDKKTRYAEYRRLKSSGTAHKWQQQISQGNYDEINFDTIAGKALHLLANSRFLENHNLTDRFTKWIDSKEVAKFTGYPYELLSYNMKPYQRSVANKQFKTLIDTAKQDMNTKTKFITCIDSSGSMSSSIVGSKTIQSIDVAISMAIYFGYLLEGEFSKSFLEFSHTCVYHKLTQSTPTDDFDHLKVNLRAYGSTNFCSVARFFVDTKIRTQADESEFPTGLICISDGEFSRYSTKETNFYSFKNILRNGGFSEEFVNNFKLVLWDIPNKFYSNAPKTSTFESFADAPNMFYMSGFDPSAMAFLTGTVKQESTPKTAEELFEAAMQQEVLQMLKL